MIKEALEYMKSEFKGYVVQAHGIAYRAGDLVALPSPEAMADPLVFHSLSGLVDYIQEDPDGNDGQWLVVDGPASVRLVAGLTVNFRQREVLAKAVAYESAAYPYGQYMDLERFITSLQSHFVQDEQTAAILKLVGNITSEEVATHADDGVTQNVTARAGIARVASLAVPNPVTLRPFRTFPEVEQPASKFVLRLKRGDGGPPTAALFETGDMKWKHEATESIKGKLEELQLGTSDKVKVFA